MLEYIQQLEKEFHQSFTEVGRDAHTEAIHGLRLNLKRQRALFQLMEHLDSTFSASLAKEAYGKLYKRIGKLRNLQVEQQVIREDEELLGVEPSFSSWLAEEAEEAKAMIREYEASFSLVNVRRLFSLLRNRLYFVPAEAWKDRLNSYFSGRFSALRQYGISVPGRARDFHECRRLVKELAYNLHLIQGLCDEPGEAFSELDWLNELQQLLGAWHDRFFSLEHIHGQQPDCPPAIPAQLQAEQRVLAEQIEEQLDQLGDRVNALEAAWESLLQSQKLLAASRKPRPKPGSATHPAFGQVNVSEGTK